MTTLAQNLTPVSMAAASLSRQRSDEQEADMKAVRRLALDSVGRTFKFVFGGARSLLELLWKIVMAIVGRVAKVFGVTAAMPSHPPANGEPVAAELTAEPGQAGELATQMAAQSAARHLSEFVKDAISRQIDPAALDGAKAEAFIGLALDEFGGSLQKLRNDLVLHQEAAMRIAEEVGAAHGVPAQSILAMLDSPQGMPAINHPRSDELQEHVKQMREIRLTKDQVEMAFCEHAIAAGQMLQQAPGVAKIAQDKISVYADAEMKDVIFSEIAGEKSPVTDKNSVNSALPELHSQNAEQNAMQFVESAQGGDANTFVPAATARRSWAGRVVGVVPNDVEDGGRDRDESMPRMRE